MTKRIGTGETVRRRYREMAAAAAKCAAGTKKPRDRAVYLALAQGWEALAAEIADDPPRVPARKAKAKPKPKANGG